MGSTSIWSGFYKKSLKERQSQIQLSFPQLVEIQGFKILEEEQANNMIENCIGITGLPLGLALNAVINSKSVVIPMVVEEPSVVAAVSGASKLISACGGFTGTLPDRNIIFAQVQLLDIADNDLERTILTLNSKKPFLISQSNEFCKTMFNRGGGVVDLTIRQIKKSTKNSTSNTWVVVHFHIDVCDAMGANCASTVAEGMAPFLAQLTGCRIGFRIVSNLATERFSTAKFQLPVSKLGYKGFDGMEVAKRIVDAYEWAVDDPYRAVTHNKGIMNGIDAVALATGQDWRAIEAACHSWASLKSDAGYKPLTEYSIEELHGEHYLIGKLELPLTVGTAGGVLKTNPSYQLSLGLMGSPNSKELALSMVCIGLAQNFAALRALATEGIQRGHMSLHARNIAIAGTVVLTVAGAPSHAISECVTFMIETNRINQSAVIEYLAANQLQSQLSNLHSDDAPKQAPSMFYFEDTVNANSSLEPVLSLNIAFKTFGDKPVNIMFTNESNSTDSIAHLLFGQKSYNWITSVFHTLEKIKLTTIKPVRANQILSKKLKLLSMIMNIICKRIYLTHPNETKKFIKAVLESPGYDPSYPIVPNDSSPVSWSAEMIGAIPLVKTHSGAVLVKEDTASHSLKSSSLFQANLTSIIEEIVSQNGQSVLLTVGLPLLLAVWQVFECRILEWVGSPLLASTLLTEQRHVVASIIGAINPVDFDQAISISAKRMQVTMFLLSDAVRFQSGTIQPNLVTSIHSIGSTLERDQILAHDLSPMRLYRDIQLLNSNKLSLDCDISLGVTNTFLIWLNLNNSYTVEQILSLLPESKEEWKKVYESLIPLFKVYLNSVWKPSINIFDKDSPFDTTGLKQASSFYLNYYDVAWIESAIN
ncbi:hypothetical protein HDV04_002587 [Boothiomyces sp. JEL0838]|nr:hypothetical protein HDV04_002587 [Boothiomyces sp. JEL0838]